jgi:hypothetical protein
MFSGTLGCMYDCTGVCIGRCMEKMEKTPVIDESRKNLYSEIELLIITWSNDGTRTAGSLTRDIMELLNNKG